MEQHDSTHRRRVRYQGTHPKVFGEKYKELSPEKYAATVDKIRQKGNTPAGMHIPICVEEILAFLQVTPGQTGLDATLGYGGHAARILEKLAGQGHLHALDIDPIEIVKTSVRLDSMGYGPALFTAHNLNFGNLHQIANLIGPLDFILADLGVSSMQIDNPQRGFSYKKEGPLDLRLNPQSGITAAQRLLELTQGELEGLLLENADEPYAAEIAQTVMAHLNHGGEIVTTTQLRRLVEEALSPLPKKGREEAVKKSCQRTFQALRIDINSEFEVLGGFLDALPQILTPGGRVAILTFHSGEDRLVKKAFKEHHRQGLYKEIATEVIRPTPDECSRNTRARSTKMRWAIKT